MAHTQRSPPPATGQASQTVLQQNETQACSPIRVRATQDTYAFLRAPRSNLSELPGHGDAHGDLIHGEPVLVSQRLREIGLSLAQKAPVAVFVATVSPVEQSSRHNEQEEAKVHEHKRLLVSSLHDPAGQTDPDLNGSKSHQLFYIIMI